MRTRRDDVSITRRGLRTTGRRSAGRNERLGLIDEKKKIHWNNVHGVGRQPASCNGRDDHVGRIGGGIRRAR